MFLLGVRNLYGIDQIITGDVGGVLKVWVPVFDDIEVKSTTLLIYPEHRLADIHGNSR